MVGVRAGGSRPQSLPQPGVEASPPHPGSQAWCPWDPAVSQVMLHWVAVPWTREGECASWRRKSKKALSRDSSNRIRKSVVALKKTTHTQNPHNSESCGKSWPFMWTGWLGPRGHLSTLCPSPAARVTPCAQLSLGQEFKNIT